MRRFLITVAGLLCAAVAVAAVLLPGDADAAPPLEGCSEIEAKELYVQRAYACQDGAHVLTFADDRARDDYLRVARHFGTAVIEIGVHWARVHH